MIQENNLRVLGAYKKSGSQLIFKRCPFCQNDNWNFEVNLEKEVFHDWVCNEGGSLKKLCRVFNLPIDNDNWVYTEKQKPTKQDEIVFDDFDYIDYEKSKKLFVAKGIEKEDIVRFSLMTTSVGKYKDKLVVPLYEGNKLAYFVARDVGVKGRYCNVDRSKINLLPYYLGDKTRYWLYLSEGIFDAISINKLGFSSGVLLGTNLSREQILKIIRFGFTRVIVCLDGDAKKKALKMVEKILKFSLPATLILFEGNEDPNNMYVRDKKALEKKLFSPSDVTLADKVKIISGKG